MAFLYEIILKIYKERILEILRILILSEQVNETHFSVYIMAYFNYSIKNNHQNVDTNVNISIQVNSTNK